MKRREFCMLIRLACCFLTVITVLSFASCSGQFSENETIGDLKVHFIDVGQGDSTFIEFPDNTVMLIDSGEQEYANNVGNYIRSRGYEKIDYLVATHPHSDHMGSMHLIVKNFDIGSIYMPDAQNNSSVFEKLLEEIDNKGLSVTTAKTGDLIKKDASNDITVEILSPADKTYNDLNNYSIVIMITYNHVKYLFMGDAEKQIEEEITASVKADVIKVGHHGSSTSSASNFVNKVRPMIAVISVGEDNEYNHPDFNVVKRWESVGAKVYRTDELGTITVSSDGTNIAVSNQAGSETITGNTQTETVQLFEYSWILNNSSKKIHKPNCASVATIKDENRQESHLSLEELENQGYKRCAVCKPE